MKHRAAWTAKFGKPGESQLAPKRLTLPPDRMNKTERRFHDQYLQLLVHAGEATSVGFQRLKLRLADKTWYTPDFDLVEFAGQIRIYEVKGHWEDDARVKIKVVAELYPHFDFYGVRWVERRWQIEHFRRKPRQGARSCETSVIHKPGRSSAPAPTSNGRSSRGSACD